MKLKNLLHRIPRPLKACVYSVLVILLACAYYIALGCPTLTLKQEMRRAEIAHMVGPSKIVDTLHEGQYSEFEKLLVSETEDGICFFGRYYDNYPYNILLDEKQYMFSYIEKTDNMTLCAAPNVWARSWSVFGFKRSLPVYLFVDEQKAVEAKITIHATGSNLDYRNEEKNYNKVFAAVANRSDNGFFRFWIEASDEGSLAALYDLSTITNGSARNFYSNAEDLCVITATVQLYDAEGRLLTKQDLTLFSNAT